MSFWEIPDAINLLKLRDLEPEDLVGPPFFDKTCLEFGVRFIGVQVSGWR